MFLVTGASGLLGANFVMTALERSLPVTALFFRQRWEFPGAICLQQEIRSAGDALALLQAHRPAWVVHCAANANVDACEEDPEEARRSNVELPRHLAQAAREVGARMLYISSDAVYDGERGAYAETDRTNPINVYARSKLAGEEAVAEVLPDSLIIRTVIYGWNLQPKFSLAEWILSRLEQGQKVPGFMDAIFSPILVNDLSEILIEMMRRRLGGTYHVAASESVSKYEFARLVAAEFGYDPDSVEPSSLEQATLKARRPKHLSLMTAKVQRELGRSMPTVGAGLKRFRSLRESGYVARLKSLGRG